MYTMYNDNDVNMKISGLSAGKLDDEALGKMGSEGRSLRLGQLTLRLPKEVQLQNVLVVPQKRVLNTTDKSKKKTSETWCVTRTRLDCQLIFSKCSLLPPKKLKRKAD